MDQAQRILNQCGKTINAFSHICLSTNDIDIFHTCIIMLHRFFNSLMTVWMMCSSTPLKKEISAFAVLIVQSWSKGILKIEDVKEFLLSGCSVTGTMVNFCCGIRKAPPLIDTSIVPGGADCLYALFDCGLTEYRLYLLSEE